MHVNPAALTDGEVTLALVQMAQAITSQAHAITTQSTREGALSKYPHASTIASKLRDFTRMSPSFYSGPKPTRNPKSLWMRSTKFIVQWVLMKIRRLRLLHSNLVCGLGMAEDVGKWTSPRRSP